MMILACRWRQIIECADKAFGNVNQKVEELKNTIKERRRSSNVKEKKARKDEEEVDDGNYNDLSILAYKRKETSSMSEVFQSSDETIGVKVKIIISLYQIVTSLVTTFHLNWPVNFFSMVNVFGSLLNFNMVSIPMFGCLTEHSYISSFLIMTLLPIIVCIGILMSRKLWIASGKSGERFTMEHAEAAIFMVLLGGCS